MKIIIIIIIIIINEINSEKCTYIPNCNMTCPRDTISESVVMTYLAFPINEFQSNMEKAGKIMEKYRFFFILKKKLE
jgi:formate hydrogenlyase subunit 6/NADH:ubiquinone oxidoreductase subunit I